MTPEQLTPLFELGYEVDTLTRKWHDDIYSVHVRSPRDILVVRCFKRADDGEICTEIIYTEFGASSHGSPEAAHRAIVDHIAKLEAKVLASLDEVAMPAHAAENA